MSIPLRFRSRAFGWLIRWVPALALALEVHGRYSYSGLHRLFVEWHIRRSGEFDEGFDGAWAYVAALALGYGIVFAMAACRAFGKLDDHDSIKIGTGIYAIIPIGLGVAGVGWGLYLIHWGWTAGEETRVDLAAIEAGDAPPSRRLVIPGRLLADEALALSKRGARYQDVYVPLVSSDWKPGRPMAVVLKIGSSDRALGGRPREGAFEGMISPAGLPGPIRVRFEGKGLTPGRRFFVLDPGESPATVRDRGVFALVLGLALASIFSARWLPLPAWMRNRPAPAVKDAGTFIDRPLPPLIGWLIFGGFLVLMLIGLIYARLSGG